MGDGESCLSSQIKSQNWYYMSRIPSKKTNPLGNKLGDIFDISAPYSNAKAGHIILGRNGCPVLIR